MKKRILLFIIPILFVLFILLVASNKISKNPRILIVDENHEEIAYLNNLNKTNTEHIENINENYIQYILCIEDKDFYKHNGFSIPRIIKSLFNTLFKGNKQGASTITQQYVKNTYLNNKRAISRKIKELYLAIKIETKMEKNEILEEYLSALYFGNSVYGLTNAARYYYDKDVTELTDKEMISFIALWNAPNIYAKDVIKWNNKKNTLAKYLYEKGLLNLGQYKEVSKDIQLNINENYLNSNRLYYIDQVLHEFQKTGITSKFNEIITIQTFYNKNTEIVKSNLDTNYSLISMNKEGYITCCIGDKNYYTSKFNIAMQGKRDIGSTIKPLLYYEAIKCGFENEILKSELYSFQYKNETITVSNSSNSYYNDIDMRTAIAVSDNIYAIKTHLNLGMNTLVQHLKKYQIETTPYPSLALGSVGMSLKQLLSIYSQFFSNGDYIKPKYIFMIYTGKKQYKIKPDITTPNNPVLCNKIKVLLNAPFDTSIPHATCNSITKYLNTTCYGKSGLTDYDSYMIGFNEENLVAVWSGDIDNEKLLNTEYKKLPKELFYRTMNVLS